MPKPVTLDADPERTNATPGASALFTIRLTNGGLVATDVRLDAAAPADWAWDVDPSPTVHLEPGASADRTLIVDVPSGASPGTNATLTLTAVHADGLNAGQAASDAIAVVVDVVAPPPPPPPSSKPAPKFSLTAASASAAPGETAIGAVLLRNSDVEALSVALAIQGDAAWAPHILAEDQNRNVHAGSQRVVAARAVVPDDASEGEKRTFTLVATIVQDGVAFTFSAPWEVTALARSGPSPSSTSSSTSPQSGSSGSAPSPGSSSGAPPAPRETYALTAVVRPDPLEIQPGGSATGAIHLVNTGSAYLHLTFSGSAAANWPLRFAEEFVELAPGATHDVPFTVSAPDDVIPGGTGSGSAMIEGDNGLLRTAPFKLQIVFPDQPRDESRAAVVAAPVGGATAPAGVSAGTLGLAAGLATVGAGALALARRPVREKLLWAAVGLYTRLARPDVLGHPERERLYRIVEAQPGVHFHALQRELQWNTGTLTYHLRVLERHGFVVDRRDGTYRRFYISGAAPRKELFDPSLPQGLRALVLEAIRNQHGISQSDLALALSANKQTVNYHVKALERQGIIRVEKRGRETFLYPATAPGLGPGAAQA